MTKLEINKEQAYEDFILFMDSIFYEGYAEQLAKENPEHFNQELSQYFDNYSNTYLA